MRNLTKISMIAIGIMTASMANAATDGVLAVGDNTITSDGNLVVSLEIPHVIEVSGLTDIAFGLLTPAQMDEPSTGLDWTVANGGVGERFCVRSNDNIGFDLTLTSSTGVTAFQMEGGTTSEILPYTVEYATVDSAGTTGAFSAVTSGTAITGITEQRRRPNCDVSGSPVDNIEINVTVAQNDLYDRAPDEYEDLLLVVVSPN